jgi:hypothetical protein
MEAARGRLGRAVGRARHRALYKAALAGTAGTRRDAKCVWCERFRGVHQELQVDHHRPKGRVTRWVGDPDEDSDTPPSEETVSERGYWWLGYAWRNWNLACAPCNATWKRCLFPRSTNPTIAEGVETHEGALLLDPTSDFATRDHFRWDTSGRIFGVSAEGHATIITCGLNRTALKEARRTKVADLKKALDDFAHALHAGPDEVRRAARRVCGFGAAQAEFAGMARHFIEVDPRFAGTRWEEFVKATQG